MSKRIGKYKVSKRESQMSLVDGGTINGSTEWNLSGTSFGIHEAAFEINFGTGGRGISITGTDNGLIATVATIPDNVLVLDAFMVTTEAFDSTDEKGMDLVVTSTSPAAADTAITGDVVQIITAFEAKSNSSGALGSISGGVSSANTAQSINASGDGTHLCLINTDGSNGADAIQTGKIVVYITYIGDGPAVENTTV